MMRQPTHMRMDMSAARAPGFTLIELMITVVILAILLSIAIPAYQSEMQKSRRTDAKTTLLDLSSREQRYYSVNNTFTNSAQNLGYGAAAFPMNVGSGTGDYSVSVTAPAAANPPTFTITATPIGVQASDTACGSFTIDNTGNQTTSGTDTAAACWGR